MCKAASKLSVASSDKLLRLRRVAEDNLEFTQVRPFVMTVYQNWTIGL
jgi:hypothetical protein